MPSLRTICGKAPLVPVPTRVNECQNPLTVDSSGWAHNAGAAGVTANVTIETSGSPVSSTFRRMTWTTASTTAPAHGQYYGSTQTEIVPAAGGDVFSAGCWVRSSIAAPMVVYGQFYDNGAVQKSVVTPAVQVAANTWTWLAIENVAAPAGNTGFTVLFYYTSGAPLHQVGDTMDVAGCLIEKGPTLGSFFAGTSQRSADGHTYRWAGVPNQSTSEELAEQRLSLLDVDGVTWRSVRALDPRRNLQTNPAFRATFGNTEVRRNYVLNPGFAPSASTVEVRRNLVTNPSFRATSGTSEVRRNHVPNPKGAVAATAQELERNTALNPAMRSTTAASAVRKNYIANPCGRPNRTSWGVIGSGSLTFSTVVDATAPQGGSFVRGTMNADGSVGFGAYTVDSLPVGDYTGSFWVRASVALGNWITYCQGTATKTGYSKSMGAIPANTWTRLNITLKVTAAGTVQVGGYPDNMPTGSTLDMTGVMLNDGTALQPYFDGASAAAGDFTYGWSGTADASTSEERALPVAEWSHFFGKFKPWQTAYGPDKAARFRLVNGQQAQGFFRNGGFTVAAGQKSTTTFWVYLPGRARNARIEYGWKDAANAYLTGVTGNQGPVVLVPSGTLTPVRFTGPAAPANATMVEPIIRFTDADATETDEVVIAKALVTNSDYSGPYFDGSTTATRRNLCVNPNGEGAGGWNDNNSALSLGSWDTTVFRSGTRSRRGEFVSGTSTLSLYNLGGAPVAAAPGKTYTLSVHLRALIPSQAAVGFHFINASGSTIGSTVQSVWAPMVADGSWERFSVTATAPAGTVTVRALTFVNRAAGYTPAAGDMAWADDVLLEEASTVLPYFDGTTSTDRKNLHPNPSAETNTASWGGLQGAGGGTATMERRTTGGYAGAAHIRINWSVAPPSAVGGIYAFGAPVTPGKTYTASIYVRSNIAQVVRGALEWKNGTGGANGSVLSGNVILVPNVWTRISVVGALAPAAAATCTMTVYGQTGSGGITWQPGDWIDGDACLVEEGSSLLPWFDGATKPNSNRKYAWAGTANASASIETDADLTHAWVGAAELTASTRKGTGVGYHGGSRGILYRTADRPFAGDYAVRFYATATDKWDGAQRILPTATVTAGQKISVAAWVRSPLGKSIRIQVQWLDAAYASIGAIDYGQGAPAPDSTWTVLRTDFTPPTGAVRAYVWVGLQNPAGDATPLYGETFDMGGIVVTEAPYQGDYFDGSTLPDGALTYSWAGNPDETEAVVTGKALTGWGSSSGRPLRTQGPAYGSGFSGEFRTAGVNFSDILPGAAVGKLYSAKVKVAAIPGETPAGSTAYTRLHDGGYVSSIESATALPADGTPVEIITTAIAATTTTALRLYVYGNGGAPIRVIGALVEEVNGVGLPVHGSFFDGLTPAADGLTYAWSGVADASAATATGKKVDNWVGNVGLPVWAGADGKSMRALVKAPGGNCYQPNAMPAAAGELWTHSFSVESDVPGKTGYIRAIAYAAGSNGALSSIEGPNVAINGKTRLAISQSALPTDSAGVRSAFYSSEIGARFTFREALSEKTTAALPYFDGSTAAKDGLTYSWSGTAGASESIATGPMPAGWTAYTASSLGRSRTGWKNGEAMRFLEHPSSVYPGSIPATPGETYTGSMWVQLDASATGPVTYKLAMVPAKDGTSVWPYFYGDMVTINPGKGARVWFTLTVPEGVNGFRPILYPTSFPSVPLEIAQVLVERAHTVGSYFDGASRGVNIAADGYWGSLGAGTTIFPANGRPAGGVQLDGKEWVRITYPVGGNAARMTVPLEDLEQGAPYTVSMLVHNESDVPRSFTPQWCDLAGATPNVTLDPRETRRISFTAARPQGYNSTYRFIDIERGGGEGPILVREVQVERGTEATTYRAGEIGDYRFAWEGAADASVSIATP